MAETLDEDELEQASAAAQPKLSASAMQPAFSTSARRLQKSDVLTLDVGGTMFRTRVETLTAHSTFFRDLLLSAGAIEVNLNQPLFLDLDPEAFNLILQFFRSKSPDALFGCLARYYPAHINCTLYEHNLRHKHINPVFYFGFCRVCWFPLGYASDSHSLNHQINTRRLASNSTYCAKCGPEKLLAALGRSLYSQTYDWHTDNVIRTSHSKPAADMYNVVYQLRYLQVAPFAEYLNWPGWAMPAQDGGSAEKKREK
eukprot:g49280.t1